MTLVQADVATFVSTEPPDAVVLNEVFHHLPHPLRVAQRVSGQLAEGDVLVVCCHARTWPARRLLVRLARRVERAGVKRVGFERVRHGRHAWDVCVFRAAGRTASDVSR